MDTIFDNILCATDLSWGCSDIFRDLTKVQEGGLVKKMRMLYVVPEEEGRKGQTKEDALGEMTRLKRDLEILGVPVEMNVREGLPAEEIVKEASEWDASIIVMSRVDRGVIEDIVSTGTSMAVVRNSPVPVLVEKHAEDVRGHVFKAPLWPLDKVLVPVDVNEEPWEAMEFLKPLAHSIVREVVLAHIVAAGLPKEVQRDFETSAESTLAEYAQEFEKLGIKATVHVHRGEPAAGIIEIAVEEKTGMVIMPAKSPTSGKALGSVAEEMLKHSPAPVIFLLRPYKSALKAA